MSAQPPRPTQEDHEHLRDARLVQALKHMPDAHLQPNPLAQRALIQAAQEALKKPSQTPGWVRTTWHWLVGRPSHRLPLAGATASVLIASFVTLMWYEKEVPESNPQAITVAQAPFELEKADRPPIAARAPSPPDMAAANASAGSIAKPAPKSAPAAPVAAAPVAPAAMAPAAPVMSEATLNETSLRSDAATKARPNSEMANVVVVHSGVARELLPSAANALLTELRALTGKRTLLNETVIATRNAAKAKSADASFTVKSPEGEVWVITPSSVHYTGVLQGTSAATADRNPVTSYRSIGAAEWEHLRALALPAAAP